MEYGYGILYGIFVWNNIICMEYLYGIFIWNIGDLHGIFVWNIIWNIGGSPSLTCDGQENACALLCTPESRQFILSTPGAILIGAIWPRVRAPFFVLKLWHGGLHLNLNRSGGGVKTIRMNYIAVATNLYHRTGHLFRRRRYWVILTVAALLNSYNAVGFKYLTMQAGVVATSSGSMAAVYD
jgi:hypothetical protein